jgi:hypothetical protein
VEKVWKKWRMSEKSEKNLKKSEKVYWKTLIVLEVGNIVFGTLSVESMVEKV